MSDARSPTDDRPRKPIPLLCQGKDPDGAQSCMKDELVEWDDVGRRWILTGYCAEHRRRTP